jgi:hypothetical protein
MPLGVRSVQLASRYVGWHGPRPLRPISTPVTVRSVALLGAALLGFASAHSPQVLLVVIFGLATLCGLLVAPARWLGALALVVTLVIPTNALPVPGFIQGLALGALPFAIWTLRGRRMRVSAPSRVIALLLVFWLAASEVFAPIHTKRGIAWFVVALVVIALPALFGVVAAGARSLRRTFLFVTTGLGCYAIVEGFVLHANPLYGPLYAANQSFVHTWTGYRVETLMGHPLVNGTIFAAAVVLAANELFEVRNTFTRSAARFGVLAGALAATQSRGAAIAAVAGVMALVVFNRAAPRLGARKLTLVLVGIALAAGLGTSLAARQSSAEGQSSAQIHLAVPAETARALEGASVFGAGPGQADAYRVARQLRGTGIALESGYAELAVSLGVAGALLFVALVLSSVAAGLRNRASVGEACALLTILIAVGGYNALEGHMGSLVIIGLFMASIAATHRGESAST